MSSFAYNSSSRSSSFSGPPTLYDRTITIGLLTTFTIVTSAWGTKLYSLSTQTIAWTILFTLCHKLGPQSPGRFGGMGSMGQSTAQGLGKRRREIALVAACILGESICKRAAGVAGEVGWGSAFAPLFYVLLRNLSVGATAWPTEWAIANRRLLLAAITITSFLVMLPAKIERPTIMLGLCAAVFKALGYVLLEDQFWNQTGEEIISSWMAFGKVLSLYLVLGFMAGAVLFENALGEVFSFQREGWEAMALRMALGWKGLLGLVWIAAVEVGKWGLVPFVIARGTAVSWGFADLGAVVLIGLAGGVGVGGFLAGIVAIVGMVWWGAGVLGQAAAGGLGGFGLPATSGESRATTLKMPLRWSQVLVMFLGVSATFGGLYAVFMSGRGEAPRRSHSSIIDTPATDTMGEHPIPQLINAANEKFDTMVEGQSKTLKEAVQEYKKRYGINPPPNFDRWFQFAKDRNVVLIDEYDMIFDMLRPFWGQPPAEIRKRAREAMGFRDDEGLKANNFVHAYIRSGKVQTGGQGDKWQKDATAGMMKDFVAFLPDMDLAFNIHDEPRIVVPHDILSQHLDIASATLSNASHLTSPINAFTAPPTSELSVPAPDYPFTTFNVFAHQSTWTHATASCPSSSPARLISPSTPDSTTSFTTSPIPFVTNITAASDICLSPSFSNRFGFFSRPNAFNVALHQLPIFSQSKVSSFGDILYPSPWYWSQKVAYDSSADLPWEKKTNKLYWRGSTTGGFSRQGSWKRQHRQRIIAIIESLIRPSSTLASAGPVDLPSPLSILTRTDPENPWQLKTLHPPNDETASLSNFFDSHFSHIGQCDPSDCSDMRSYFSVAPFAKLEEAYKFKYLLDLDGNAFSGRYHAFLESKSAVVKSQVFREWHDEWLQPWVHYIPLGLGGEEIVELMRFLGEEGGERVGREVAERGRSWAKRMLRKEDLEAWFFRLLIEYGRVIDDNRENIGFSIA